MDIAKSLVKCVARAFYDTKHTLVLDALMIHNAVRDDELAKLLGLQTKDLHKLCGKLKEDRMIAVHTRAEQKEGQQRPVSRTYYFVEFRTTIDAVKFRMHRIAKEVENKMNTDADQKGYVCPRCGQSYELLQAVTLERDDSGMFCCERCGHTLVDDDDSAEVRDSQERLGRLLEQTRKIVEFLKQIDDVVVPENDFETAIANSVPVPKDKNQLTTYTVPVTTGKAAAAAKIAPTPSLEISITSDNGEKTEKERAEEKARREAQAEKNALPVWHTQSTVAPGQTTDAGLKEAAERRAREADLLNPGTTKKEENGDSSETNGTGHLDVVAAYYAALAEQKAREDAEEEEDEDDDDDDEDEEEEEEAEFEDLDVGVSTVTSVAATPAASQMVNSKEGDDEPPGKRQKLDVSENDSEEEADFEDV